MTLAGAYIGTVGSLISLPDQRGSEGEQSERSASFFTTLGGRKIAQLGPASRRSWSVSLPSLSQTELARLAVLLDSVPMPYVWLSIWATRTNTLTPAQARFDQAWSSGATVGGLVDLEGGGVAVSLLEASLTGRTFAAGCPVVPGVPVTGSVFARPAATGTSRIDVSFRDAAGTLLTTTSGAARTLPGSGPLGRLTVTATPPSGAATCSLTSSNVAMHAGPALTFTSRVQEWGLGAGCRAAVVSGFSRDPVVMFRDGLQRSALSFTVTEVG